MDKPVLKDHRQIGQELDLYSFHEAAPGAVFWHPKGWRIYLTLQEYIRQMLDKEGYTEISSPVMVKSELFKKSGHWEHYKENMFNLENEKESYSLKPMNCPESTLIYSTKTRSYQDLPIRYSDFGILHRNELSGVVGGLFRVRQMTQDDAHLYVRPDQIQDEIIKLLNLITNFYKMLKFETNFFLSTMPDKAMGDPKVWKEAEKDLQEALKSTKVKYGIKEKEGAFYGPKIDIHLKDSQNRDWQVATIQLDFQIPERMKLEYIDKDGLPKRPIMIHRAILGSFERFIGVLTEHLQGAFPLWLSPVQIIIMPITDKQEEFAKKLTEDLKKEGIRTEMDNRPERLQAKIRDGSLQKVPYLGIIGNREIEQSSISVRKWDGKDLGALKISDFLLKLKEEIDKKI
jgi:threonyl-tRNA synthetase